MRFVLLLALALAVVVLAHPGGGKGNGGGPEKDKDGSGKTGGRPDKFRDALRQRCEAKPETCKSTPAQVERAKRSKKFMLGKLVEMLGDEKKAARVESAMLDAKKAMWDYVGVEMPEGEDDGLFDGDLLLNEEQSIDIALKYRVLKKQSGLD